MTDDLTPDWNQLRAARDDLLEPWEDTTTEEQVRAIIEAYERQRNESGYVAVRKDDLESIVKDDASADTYNRLYDALGWAFS